MHFVIAMWWCGGGVVRVEWCDVEVWFGSVWFRCAWVGGWVAVPLFHSSVWVVSCLTVAVAHHHVHVHHACIMRYRDSRLTLLVLYWVAIRRELVLFSERIQWRFQRGMKPRPNKFGNTSEGTMTAERDRKWNAGHRASLHQQIVVDNGCSRFKVA